MKRWVLNFSFILLLVLSPHSFGSRCLGLTKKLVQAPGYLMGINTAIITDIHSPSQPDVFLVSAQKGLSEEEKVDSIKNDMKNGIFDFEGFENRIGGYYQEHSPPIFQVNEGNHRLAAALEIAKETGNWSYAKKLLANGNWDKVEKLPVKTYPTNIRQKRFDPSWKKFLKDVSPRTTWW